MLKRVSLVSRLIFEVLADAGTPVVTEDARCASAHKLNTAQRTIRVEKNEIKRRRASSSIPGGILYFTGQRRMRSTREAQKMWGTARQAASEQLQAPRKSNSFRHG